MQPLWEYFNVFEKTKLFQAFDFLIEMHDASLVSIWLSLFKNYILGQSLNSGPFTNQLYDYRNLFYLYVMKYVFFFFVFSHVFSYQWH